MEGQLPGRVDQCVLRWFGHVERMDEERMAKKVMISNVEGNTCKGRPRLGWMDGVRMALGKRGMSMEHGKLNTLDGRRWELIVSSVKTWFICMCSHHIEVCTHLYMVRAGSHQKRELRNWGDVPVDNLWSDSIT